MHLAWHQRLRRKQIVGRAASQITGSLEIGVEGCTSPQGLISSPAGRLHRDGIAPIGELLLLKAEVAELAQGVITDETDAPTRGQINARGVREQQCSCIGTRPVVTQLHLQAQG